MELSTKYNPLETEDKWYSYWLENKLFKSVPDRREPYTIVIPPPNVTGVLHMGHMLNNTIQDILIRRARMLGKNACWIPGTDHASIATEAKVVTKLKEEGISKYDISRDEFLKHAWDWKDKHGGIILEQLKKLGASCDWDRTAFTMDTTLSESVIHVFIDLYKKGLIYRGVRMINWDPQAKTAVSDEEVNYKEVQSKLFYLRYKIEGTDNEWITIATTRPETVLGDTAVCVHPEDERYRHLKGKNVIIPLIKRVCPVIFDSYVDREFGTGALKITPAHDINDYELGIKYNLESVDIFNDDGTLSEEAILYIGQDRFAVREAIVKEFEKEGHLVKIENYVNKIGFSERTDAIIEPKLSTQWFMHMKELAQPALVNVMNDNVKLIPEKFKNTYRHWMENVKDWCISRQLWWGHRIPAYYIGHSNDFVVAKNIEEALKRAIEKTNNTKLTFSDLHQDEDVLDTWFSSWLWPISVFDGICRPENPDINYYYPTSDLITAPDILFFWVARMIIAGYEYQKDKPFNNVYLTGMVRDKQGRKMSKSLGNSPDPIELMHKYGADGVRVGMLLCSAAGNDLLFDELLVEQGRNFANKIWNAFRLVKSWETSDTIDQPVSAKTAILWLDAKLNESAEIINQQFKDYRLSETLMTVYKLFWDEFSSWYLEIIKPAFGSPIDKSTYDSTIGFFDNLLRMLHPFMPFITEEIWQTLETRKKGESIMTSLLPSIGKYNKELIENFEFSKQIITEIRSIRKEKNIPFKESISLYVKVDPSQKEEKIKGLSGFEDIIRKSLNLSEIKLVSDKVNGAVSFIVKAVEYYVPLANLIDVGEEITKISKELEYARGFHESVLLKLKNEKFVHNAKPELVERERTKLAETETKIKSLEERLAGLQKA